MTTTVSTLSASSMAEDLFKAPYQCQSALAYGAVVVADTANTDQDCTAPSAALVGGIVGVLVSAGTLTSGAFGACTAGDAVVVQKLGRAVCILATSQTAVRGQRAVIANTSGHVRPLVAGEATRGIVGTFKQSKTTTSAVKYIEVDLEIQNLADVTPTTLADPGNAGAIPVTALYGVCNITTAGAETRTLAAPTMMGQRIVLCHDTDGGDGVITVASAFNQAGNTIITLNDAGDHVELVCATIAGAKRWRIVNNDGASLS